MNEARTKRFLNTKEIAVYLCVSEHTIRAWVKTGQILFSKFGKSVRFDLDKIEIWLKKKEHKHTSINFT